MITIILKFDKLFIFYQNIFTNGLYMIEWKSLIFVI